jgi:hypothetical protein
VAIDIMKKLGYTGFVPALRENTGFRPRSPMGEGTTEPHTVRGRPVYSEEEYRRYVLDRESLPPPGERPAPGTGPTMYVGEDGKAHKYSKAQKTELAKRNWITDPSRITDRTVVSKMVELDYRAYRKSDPRFRQVVEVVTAIGSEIMTGFPLRFLGIEENQRGLYPQFGTPDGSLALDKLSQGTQSVIQWVSHLVLGMAEYYGFPPDLTNRPGVFIIDEIDAHMHPEWQRRIVPTIIKVLPNCQLFVSTHSPLILSGLAEGQVQLLSRDSNNEVMVSKNDEDTVGWSVDEIMRWLMGMAGTFDSETERVVTDLRHLRKKSRLTKTERAQVETLQEQIHARLLRARKGATQSTRVEGHEKTSR